MFRKMRAEAQLLPKTACEEVLQKHTCGVLALNGDDDYPYAVPVNYGYKEDKIIFHSSPSGYKVECIAKNPKACFTVVDQDNVVQEDYTSYFRSVIATGTLKKVEDPEEYKQCFFDLIDILAPDRPVDERHDKCFNCGFGPVNIYVLQVENLTGKIAEGMEK